MLKKKKKITVIIKSHIVTINMGSSSGLEHTIKSCKFRMASITMFNVKFRKFEKTGYTLDSHQFITGPPIKNIFELTIKKKHVFTGATVT